MSYTVRLSGGKIEYLGQYECATCGWVDNDESYFYKVGGRLFCSLHKGEGASK
jgi:hypothetical protein